MQNNTHYRQEEKIDLGELFLILKKRKNLIWSITIFFTLIASVYVFITKPVYELKTMIEIGTIDNKPIDNILDVKQKLSYEYKINTPGIKTELPKVKAITVPKKSNSIFSLTIHANNNEEGIEYTQTVIQNIKHQYKEKIDSYIKNKEELLNLIKEDMQETMASLTQMEQDVDNYTQKIISLRGEDAALAGIYVLQINQISTEIQKLKKYISKLKIKEEDIKLSISPLVIKPTQMVGEIEKIDKPVKPKKTLSILFALITGLILSILLTFLLEFLRKINKKEIEDN